MNFWQSMTKMQDTADEHGFGEVWQTLLQTCTLEAARAASNSAYDARLNTDADSEEDYHLAVMWTRTQCIIHDLDRPARKVTP